VSDAGAFAGIIVCIVLLLLIIIALLIVIICMYRWVTVLDTKTNLDVELRINLVPIYGIRLRTLYAFMPYVVALLFVNWHNFTVVNK